MALDRSVTLDFIKTEKIWDVRSPRKLKTCRWPGEKYCEILKEKSYVIL
jgi:hypothetical protein